MRYSESVEVEDVEEANRLIREALKESAVRLVSFLSLHPPVADLVRLDLHQTDPLTGLIDLDLLGGQSTHQRKLRSDLRREVVQLLGSSSKGYKWNDLVKSLEAQSSVPIDAGELTDVIKALEGEGSVRVSGQAHSRTVKLVGTAQQVEV